jgi:ketosteroid isomerase-like protein
VNATPGRKDPSRQLLEAEDNRRLVREAFRPWEEGDSGPFFDLVAEDVRWTVIGTTSVSGVFESKQALIDGAFGPLLERLDGPLVTRLIDLSADGDKVFLQFESAGVTTDAIEYRQVYCFAMRMRDRRIAEITAYLDTDLLERVLPNGPGAD